MNREAWWCSRCHVVLIEPHRAEQCARWRTRPTLEQSAQYQASYERGSQSASDQPIYEDVYGEVLALTGSHVLATLSVGRYAGVRQHHALIDALPPKARAAYEAWELRERGSQAPRSSPSPAPDHPYAAWIA